MRSRALRADLERYIRSHEITKKFAKQLGFFLQNPRHPSLRTERLEPRGLKIYSFRIDKKYRAIFIFLTQDEIEIVDINDHYR